MIHSSNPPGKQLWKLVQTSLLGARGTLPAGSTGSGGALWYLTLSWSLLSSDFSFFTCKMVEPPGTKITQILTQPGA